VGGEKGGLAKKKTERESRGSEEERTVNRKKII
jgi:hypothetical protein